MILYDRLELCVSFWPCPIAGCPGLVWGIAAWIEGDWRVLLDVCAYRYPMPNWQESLEREWVRATGYTLEEFREAFP